MCGTTRGGPVGTLGCNACSWLVGRAASTPYLSLLLSSVTCGSSMSWSLFNLSSVSSRSWVGIPVVSVFASPPIAAVILSAGVTYG